MQLKNVLLHESLALEEVVRVDICPCEILEQREEGSESCAETVPLPLLPLVSTMPN